LEILREEYKADHSPPDDVTESDLEECQIPSISHGWNRYKGQCAGLCGHNRKKDCPPWDVVAAEEIIRSGTLSAGNHDPENGDSP
jgi:hypothetical protein